MDLEITLCVNGETYQLLVDPRTTLLDALHERLGLTGSKKGCDQGACGTYTVMTQLSAEFLGLPLDHIRFGLGDTEMPPAPNQGGSGLVGALGSAVHAACQQLLLAFLNVVSHDIASPLRGCLLEDVTVSHGRLHRKNDPAQGEEYTAILARHGLDELTIDGENARPQPQEMGIAPAGAFGAKFVEVRVDPDLGLLRSVQSNADPPTVLARRGAGLSADQNGCRTASSVSGSGRTAPSQDRRMWQSSPRRHASCHPSAAQGRLPGAPPCLRYRAYRRRTGAP